MIKDIIIYPNRVPEPVDHNITIMARYREEKEAEKRARPNKKNRKLGNRMFKTPTGENRREVEVSPQRRYHLRKHYKVSPEAFEMLHRFQDSCCGICGCPEVDCSSVFRLDYNHETGLARGLLCTQCVSLLGFACDNVVMLTKAIKYLENPPYHAMQFDSSPHILIGKPVRARDIPKE
jgi:hypothetical protein